MKKKASRQIVPLETIEDRIFIIRGVKVILDKDLAELYGVPTKRLNEQVRRNRHKFPEDFMFPLTLQEKTEVVAKCDHLRDLRFSHVLPYAFTEYGALQAANVLNSPKATAMSLYIIRAFVRMREIFVVNQILETRLTQIEKVLLSHNGELKDLHEKIKQLLAPPKRTDAVGFQLSGPRIGKIG